QPVAEMALAHLSTTERELERALRDTTAGQADEAARRLLLNRTADVLKSDLLISALQAGIVMNPWYERLLTALRRVLLLEVAPDRGSPRRHRDESMVRAAAYGVAARVAARGRSGSIPGSRALRVRSEPSCSGLEQRPCLGGSRGGDAGDRSDRDRQEIAARWRS